MDRYKFRAWLSGENIYAYSDRECYTSGGELLIWSFNADGQIEVGYITFDSEEYIALTTNVEQWTGLKDKNGKEIYEGDVVKFIFDDEDSCMGNTYDEIYIAEWNNRHLQIEFIDNKYHPLGTHQGKYNLHSMSHMSYVIEVIGNIHDSELLEG